jgi:hypothetical protein
MLYPLEARARDVVFMGVVTPTPVCEVVLVDGG